MVVEIKRYNISPECEQLENFVIYMLEAIDKSNLYRVETGFTVCNVDGKLKKEPRDCEEVRCEPAETIREMHGYYCGDIKQVAIKNCREGENYASIHTHVFENKDKFSIFDVASAIAEGHEATCICNRLEEYKPRPERIEISKRCWCIKINKESKDYEEIRNRIRQEYEEAKRNIEQVESSFNRGEITLDQANILMADIINRLKYDLQGLLIEAGEKNIIPKPEFGFDLEWSWVDFKDEDKCLDVIVKIEERLFE